MSHLIYELTDYHVALLYVELVTQLHELDALLTYHELNHL